MRPSAPPFATQPSSVRMRSTSEPTGPSRSSGCARIARDDPVPAVEGREAARTRERIAPASTQRSGHHSRRHRSRIDAGSTSAAAATSWSIARWHGWTASK